MYIYSFSHNKVLKILNAYQIRTRSLGRLWCIHITNYKYKHAITKKKENEKAFALMNMYTHIASAYISVYNNISFIKSVHTYVCVY